MTKSSGMWPARGAVVLLALLLCVGAGSAGRAVDTEPKTDAPDLAAVRASIKAKDFASALTELNKLITDGVQHADVYNLLGFAHRKSGDYAKAATYYAKALDFDANHKGALEYQGEMFVETGLLDKAKANLARLVQICPQGCEEREDLEKAISTGAQKAPR